MNATQKRTLTITCGEGEKVERKQHTCFVHNLIADTKRAKPLIVWKRAPKAEPDINAYYSNGLSEGTLITIRGLTDKPGVEFTYSRHGKLIYTAIETDGDVNCDMHLSHLLHKVTCAVTMAEVTQKPNPLAEVMQSLKPKTLESEDLTTKVGDIFRQITADQLVEYLFENSPNMITVGIVKGSPTWTQRENLVRAVVAYLQNVPRKDTGIQMVGFGLKRLKDNKVCGHLVTDSLSRVANAGVKFENNPYYAHLKPTEAALKFAADIVIQLVNF